MSDSGWNKNEDGFLPTYVLTFLLYKKNTADFSPVFLSNTDFFYTPLLISLAKYCNALCEYFSIRYIAN